MRLQPPEVTNTLGRCMWFLKCKNQATHKKAHPALGEVPCCDRCGGVAETPKPVQSAPEYQWRGEYVVAMIEGGTAPLFAIYTQAQRAASVALDRLGRVGETPCPTPFDRTLTIHGYTVVPHQSTETVARWTNGNYLVSCDRLSWSITHYCGSWEKSGCDNVVLAQELDRRKI